MLPQGMNRCFGLLRVAPVPHVSVVIPAHNEEAYLGRCLEAVAQARLGSGLEVETVVVLNRCTDRTESLAAAAGALLVPDDSRCLATIRNRGVAASHGSVVMTCDADSQLHPRTLRAAVDALDAGAIGGGVPVRFDRRSWGIRATELLLDVMVVLTGTPCGAFWTTRAAFDAVGGFDERLPMGEDVDFAKRLRALGRRNRRPYRLLAEAPLLTSARKFDRFGDWSFFGMMLFEPLRIRRSLKGEDTDFVDEYFYDFNDQEHRASLDEPVAKPEKP